MSAPLLHVDGLTVSFPGARRAVDQASFTLDRGESLVLAGESGSGKSLLCRALLGIEPETAKVTGHIGWKGRDLASRSASEMRQLRGGEIAMIFQDPTAALNPLLSVGRQIMDVVRAHRACSAGEARARAVEVLGQAGLPEPERRLRNHPSELSGGMRQRVAIALALAAGPELIIADEATTNLDVSLQAQIVTLLHRLQAETGVALIFVTHDLDLAAEVGGRLMVLYGGQPVETGPVAAVLSDACHPYTRGLLHSAPTLRSSRSEPLQPIPGQAPRLGSVRAGCPFLARCPVAIDGICDTERPGWSTAGPVHQAACHRFARDGRAGLP